MNAFTKSLIPALLAMLFIYAAVSKLLTFEVFREQLYNQDFPHWLGNILLYILPPLEIITAALLCFRSSIIFGLWLSLLLLIAFTGYISLVLVHFWSRTPCSCGGLLSHMSWTTHLIFNWFFLINNIIALYLGGHNRAHRELLTD